MRNPDRIDKFCTELAEIWKTNCPDQRFGQFMMNVLGDVQTNHGDPWFPEEDKMIEYIRESAESMSPFHRPKSTEN